MHLLHESDAASITGGDKPDLGLDPSPRPTHPLPIWHPIFVADP